MMHKNIAVVGCGRWGRNHVRNFYELGALAAVCDINQDVMNEMSKTYDVPGLKWHEVLRDENIKGVAIVVPSAAHGNMARDALNAGKHVFIEKPLTLNYKEAKELSALASEKGLTLMVGHLLQYHPAYLKLLEVVGSGSLGNIKYICSNRLNMSRIQEWEDCIWDFAPHDLSMILGIIDEAPIHVFCGTIESLNPGITDTATAFLEFASGVTAKIFISHFHPQKEQKLIVVGDRGSIVFDDTKDWDQKLMLSTYELKKSGAVLMASPTSDSSIQFSKTEPLKEECGHFIQCMKTGQEPRTGVAEALRVMQVLQWMVDAAQKGTSRPVRAIKNLFKLAVNR